MASPCFALSPLPLSNRPSLSTVSSRPRRLSLRTSPLRAALESEATDAEKRVEVIPQPPTPPSSEPKPAKVEASEKSQAKEEQPVPGKIQMTEWELTSQRRALEKYSEELRRQRIEEERESSRIFGFVDYAETLNGRLAMFFIITGLLTEYWTGYTIPEQVELMARTLGIL